MDGGADRIGGAFKRKRGKERFARGTMAVIQQVTVAARWCVFAYLVLFSTIATTRASSPNVETDNVPGVAYEFKIHVDAGREECFYQYVQPTATVFVAFQVIRGGDGMAGFAVRHPNGVHVMPYQWKSEAEYEEVSEGGGYYEVCIDNQFSRFASKLVNLYMTTFRYDEWENFTAELEQMDVTVSNFTEALKVVSERITGMLRHQQFSRRHDIRDYQLLLSNNNYVQYWSIAQCAVILVASGLQVFFLRKLFDVKSVTPTAKPRA